MSQIIPQQDAIDVYATGDGEICIIQQSGYSEAPCFIYIHPLHIETLIEALREAIKGTKKGKRDCEATNG